MTSRSIDHVVIITCGGYRGVEIEPDHLVGIREWTNGCLSSIVLLLLLLLLLLTHHRDAGYLSVLPVLGVGDSLKSSNKQEETISIDKVTSNPTPITTTSIDIRS